MGRLTVGIALLAAAGTGSAQEFRGTISGQVRDATGAAIPGATVRAVQKSTNQATEATTNQDGFYALPYLQPSDYDVEASAQGFRKMRQASVTLLVAQKLDLDFKLEVGDLSQEITVKAEVEVLQTADASGGMNFDSTLTSEYALNGRQVYMMMDLAPGVLFTQEEFGATGYSGTRGWDVNGSFTFNGSKTGTTAFALNGSPISLTGTFNIAPSADAVQELKVMTNTWDAAIGRSGGGAVNTSIKSGTNQFHFTASDFIRNRLLDANTTQLNAAGKPRGKHNVNQISLTAGAPIRKNKDFIFGSIELWRERVPFSVVADVPTMDLRNGQGFSAVPSNIYDPLTSHACVSKVDVSGACNTNYIRDPFPGNVIPASRMSPIGKKILSYYPAPNYPGQVNNYIADTGGVYRYDQPIVRWDHVFNDSNRLNVLESYQWGQEFRNSTGIPGPAASGNIWTRRQPISVSANYTKFSRAYIFDVRLSFSRFSQTFPNVDTQGTVTAESLGITGITRAKSSPFNSPPRITLDQYSALFGNGSNLQTYKAENQWNLAPGVTLPKGAKTFKFGADLLYAAAAAGDTGYANGYLNFNRWGAWQYSSRTSGLNLSDGNSVADVLLGVPYSGQVDSYDSFYRSWPYFAFFVQTDWRARRNLTLNLGLRYDVQIPWVERWNRNNAGFDFNAVSPYSDRVIAQWKANKAEYDAPNPRYPYPDAPAAILGGKTFADASNRRMYDTDWTNLQPRIGVAWAFAPRSVLRTGFGVYHRTATQTGLTDGFNQTTTFARSLDGDRYPSGDPGGVLDMTGPYSLANPFPYGVQAPLGASLGLLANAGNSVSFDPRKRPIPRTFQYSFGLQRQIFWNAKLEANYVGSITNHDSMSINLGRWPYEINQTAYASSTFGTTVVKNPFYGIVPAITTRGASPTMQRIDLFRAYPLFGDVTNNIIPRARYRYDALQLRVDKRFSADRAVMGGLTLVFSYTFSKNMQSANYLNNWNYMNEQPVHELVGYDKPQNIALSGVWALPFGRGRYFLTRTNRVVSGVTGGWTLNWSYRFTSGNPVGGINAVNKCGTLLVDEQTHDRQWNNTSSCWGGNPSYMPRVVEDRYAWLRQMDNETVNLAAAKEFTLSERLKLQLRGEAFNLLNHVIWKPANTSYNNVDFGKLSIEQQNFPRQIQMSAKIRF